jgi:NAD(P)-dependent dehydrogenase (short-subunit alcohol dehydrogenase family)
VRICSISPGVIDTPMGSIECETSPVANNAVKALPIPRMGKPEEVANVVAFLCSSQASYLTACDILVDGGWVGAIRSAPEDSPFGQAMAAARRKI